MAPDNAPTWSVTAQREDFQVAGNGQLAQGVVVTFQTASGAVGSVFVPNTDYTEAKVRQLVAAKAGEMERVSRLQG